MFDSPEGIARRKLAGITSLHIFRRENDPHCIMVLAEWDNLVNARKYYHSKELQTSQEKAGVTGQPVQYVLERL